MDISKKSKRIYIGFAITTVLLITALLFSWMDWAVIASVVSIWALLFNSVIILKKVKDIYYEENGAGQPENSLQSSIHSVFISPARKQESEA
jgi:hypothetical protein